MVKIRSGNLRCEVPETNRHQTRHIGFREEVVHRHDHREPGSLLLAMPVPLTWYAATAAALVCLLVTFLALGSYTMTEKTEAVISTTGGLTPIKADEDGRIEKIHVREGETVQAGAIIAQLRLAAASDYEEQEASRADGQVAGGEEKMPSDAPDESRSLLDIRSTAAGIVYQIPVRPGQQYIAPMNVAVVAREGSLAVTTFVSPQARAGLRVGTRVILERQGSAGGEDNRLVGKVVSVALAPTEEYVRQIRATFRTYRVDIELESDEGPLTNRRLLGQAVHVWIPIRKRKLYEWLFDPMEKLFRI